MPLLIKASSYIQPLWTATKFLLLILLVGFIYIKLQEQGNILNLTINNLSHLFETNYPALMLIIVMMPLNWFLEAVKWKILVRPLGKTSFFKAFQGVLTGLSLSFMTPHGVGDYVGRIMQDSNPERGRYIGPIMLGRVCQMLPTLLFGSIGIFFITRHFFTIYLAFLLIFPMGLALLRVPMIRKGISSFTGLKIKKKLAYYFGIISSYAPATVIQIITLSMCRYLIFALQFIILLYLFIPGMDLIVNGAGVTWIFLSKSILPTFNFLSDLGVREFSAIYFFDHFNVDLIAVVNASLTLWLINILVPTVIGAPLTLKLKLLK